MRQRARHPREHRATDGVAAFEALEPRLLLSSVTVVAHGGNFFPGVNIPMQLIAGSVQTYWQGQGQTAATYSYSPSSGSLSRTGGTADADNKVIVFDWLDESSILEGGFDEAAGEAMYAMLGENDLLSSDYLHLIGHSRGTVVISEAAQRLLYGGYDVNHLTFLDTEPGYGAMTEAGNAYAWQGVDFVDNYYGDGMPFLVVTLQGEPISGAHDVYLSGVDHIGVSTWYNATVNNAGATEGYFWRKDPTDQAGATVTGSKTNIQWASNYAQVTGGIFNGDVSYGGDFTGWEYQGGGGSGVRSGGNLLLNASGPSREHNRFYVPVDALNPRSAYLTFSASVTNASADDAFAFTLQTAGGPVTDDLGVSLAATSAWTTYSVDLAPYAGEGLTFVAWIVEGGGSVDSEVRLDNFALEFSPIAPDNLTATRLAAERVDLVWDDNSSDETGFRIERKTGTGSWVEIGATAANDRTYSDTSLDPDETYLYRVTAYNSVGNSAYTNEVEVTSSADTVSWKAWIPDISGDAQISGQLDSADELDWLYYAAPVSGTVNVQVATTSVGLAETDLHIYAYNGTAQTWELVLTDQDDVNDPNANFTATQDGLYLFGVYDNNGELQDYTISVDGPSRNQIDFVVIEVELEEFLAGSGATAGQHHLEAYTTLNYYITPVPTDVNISYWLSDDTEFNAGSDTFLYQEDWTLTQGTGSTRGLTDAWIPDHLLPAGGSYYLIAVVDQPGNYLEATEDWGSNWEATSDRDVTFAGITHLVVSGPAQVTENSSGQYTATAHYDDASTQNVTGSASWVENSAYASVNGTGLVSTSAVLTNQLARVTSSYGTYSGFQDFTIQAVNDPPSAQAQSVTTNEDTPDVITLTGSDPDTPANQLVYSVETDPTHGTVSIVGDQATYTPTANYHGPDSFTFSVNDGEFDSTPATVTIGVTSVPDAPAWSTFPSDQAMSHNQDTRVVTVGATDADGDTVTYDAQVIDPETEAATLRDSLGLVTRVSWRDTASGRWFRTASWQNYIVQTDGTVIREGGTVVGQVDASYFADPDSLLTAVAGSGPAPATVTVVGTQLTIDPDANFEGTFKVEVTATDGGTTISDTFDVTVTNQTPAWSTFPSDQAMSHNEDTRVVTVSATDADGDTVTYDAQVIDPETEAATLRDSLGLVTRVSWRDTASGRWFRTASWQNYIVQTDGTVIREGGTVVGQVDASYFADPDSLLTAVAGSGVAPATVTLVGSQLTVDPDANFEGTFKVEVTATDGAATITDTFDVTVTNQTPAWSTFPSDQAMSHNEDTRVVTVSATDADGDTVTYDAQVIDPETEAATLRDSLGLVTRVSWRDTASGRWFRTASWQNYIVQTDGTVIREGGTVVGQVDASYFADPDSLLTAVAGTGVAPATVSFVGSQLTVDPDANFEGTFKVEVTASDGAATISDVFEVTVTNFAPAWSTFPSDQAMSHNEDTRVVTVLATDADGDTVTYDAQVIDPETEAATLRDSLGLVTRVSWRDTASGRWFRTASWQNYIVQTDGTVIREGGTVVGQVDTSYFADPDSLLTAVAGSGVAPATVSLVGSQLTVDPDANFEGTFKVEVTASDGAATISDVFEVTVTNFAPAWSTFPSDQAMSHNEDTRVVTVLATDADGDTVTYDAQVIDPETEAATLRDDLGLVARVTWKDTTGARWFRTASGQNYAVQTDGTVIREGGTVVGQVDASYFADPDSLLTAVAGTGPAPATVSLVGTQLTVDPDANFEGTFKVEVTASDGAATISDVFEVTVTNFAPAWSTFPSDQAMSHNEDTRVVTVLATDADGDTVTYDAQVIDPETEAATLRDDLGLVTRVSWRDTASGRWFRTASWQNYIVQTDGTVIREGGTVVGQVDASYFADPDSLLTAVAGTGVAPATVSFVGSQLTVDPDANFEGTFKVEVTASDGAATISDVFEVTVTNVAPAWSTFPADQAMSHSEDTRVVTVIATDADGDTVTYDAQVIDPETEAATLRDDLGLVARVSWRDTAGQRWFRTASWQNYIVQTDGTVIREGGTVVGQVDASYFADPDSLLTAVAGTGVAPATVSFVGSQLTVDPDANFEGTFKVEVTASDGAATISDVFEVTVTNVAPAWSTFPADQAMSHSEDTRVVTVIATDADGDTVTYDAQVIDPETEAATLRDDLGLVARVSWRDTAGQRWFRTASWQNYIVQTDGTVIREGGTVVGQVDASYFADPDSLLTAVASSGPAPATVSIVGNQLTVDPDASFVGTFKVEVTATDGAATISDVFEVTVL